MRPPTEPFTHQTSSWRGHETQEILPDIWVYVDTGLPFSSAPDRPCGHCHLPNREDEYDACLGEIEGAMNACCGHGDPGASIYIQRLDGSCMKGPEAVAEFVRLGLMTGAT